MGGDVPLTRLTLTVLSTVDTLAEINALIDNERVKNSR